MAERSSRWARRSRSHAWRRLTPDDTCVRFSQKDGRMRTRRDGNTESSSRAAVRKALLAALLFALIVPADAARLASPAADTDWAAAQIPFEQVSVDLASPDAKVRLRAVQLMKGGAYPEAALPLAAIVTDPQDDIQLEAIAAELNIFLAGPIAGRKRLGLIVEVRTTAEAEPAFSAGAAALGTQPVPAEVLTALRTAARDENRRVAAEALYAFGVLAVAPRGEPRRAMLRAAGPDIAAFIGSSDSKMRYAGVRVLGRVFARR